MDFKIFIIIFFIFKNSLNEFGTLDNISSKVKSPLHDPMLI